ncbi:MAG TPA: MFS transporter [Thermotogota bacterium]|nr:MFS transporter [Thermotogota bacterium]
MGENQIWGGKNVNTHSRNFWYYTMGRLVSLLGSGIQQVAIPLYILDLTGSGTVMGTFVFLTTLPRILFSPFGGVLGDRFDRKKIMVYMDLLRGGLILFLALMAGMESLTITILMAVQFLVSTSDIIFDPATQAMLADIVPMDKLPRANSVVQAVNSMSYIIGPALGGILYGFFGIKVVFLANGISFVASAVSECFIRYQQTTSKSQFTLKSALVDIKEGFAFLPKVKGLLLLLFFAMLSNFLIAPLFGVVFPFFTREVIGFSGQQFGFLETAWVVGILLGNVLLGTLLVKKSQEKLFKTGLIVETVFFPLFFVYSLGPVLGFFGGPTWLFFAVIAGTNAIIGTFNALVNTPLMTLFQKKTPTEFRSRVFAVIALLAQLTTPLGAILYGLALDRFPISTLFLIAMLGNSAVTIVFLALGMGNFFSEGEQPSANQAPSQVKYDEVG